MYVINTLLPLFLLLFLGMILRRTGFVPESMFRHANRLIYWVALPCMLFEKTAQVSIQGEASLKVFTALFIGMMACIAAAYVVCFILRMPGSAIGTFVQGAFRGNLVYVGLPIIYYSLAGSGGQVPPDIEALAIIPLAPIIILYNVLSVFALIVQSGVRLNKTEIRKQIRVLVVSIAANPLLLACVLGIICNLLSLDIPLFVQRFTATTGQMALPLALLGIGATLKWNSLKNSLLYTVIASCLKVGFTPFAGLIIGRYLGLSPIELKITLFYCACPTAVVSYVVAEQLNGDGDLASSIVMVSTLLSFPAFIAILLLV